MSGSYYKGPRCGRPSACGGTCRARTAGGPCALHRTEAEPASRSPCVVSRCPVPGCRRSAMVGEPYCVVHVRVMGTGVRVG